MNTGFAGADLFGFVVFDGDEPVVCKFEELVVVVGVVTGAGCLRNL